MDYVFLGLFVTLIAAASVIATKDVFEMKVNDDPGDIKMKNCKDDASMMIKSLNVTPKHIKLGDDVTVSVSAQVTRDIIAPVKYTASVLMKQDGGEWIEMCDIAPTEYCHQNDLCVVLKKKSLGYTCPIKSKTYSLSGLQFTLPKLPGVDLTGHFNVTLNLTQSPNIVVGCVNLDFCLGPCN